MDGKSDDRMGAKRGRPRRISDAERRRAIVAGAYEAFLELGFGRTTTAIVAAKARVSKRSLYEHFDDKTGLFAAVIQECRHLILDLPRPEGEDVPVIEALIRIFRLDIDAAAERERDAILDLLARESAQFPELSDYLYENQILRAREDLIEWLLEQPHLAAPMRHDPALYAGMLMDIVFGALLPRRRRRGFDRALRTTHIKKRLEIVLRGVEQE